MMTDPIADMLTRIRNAVMIEKLFVDVPASQLKMGIAQTLQREGFIWDFEVREEKPVKILRINLKYGPNGEPVIQQLKRISKPGRRVYQGLRETRDILAGMGISILSTPSGILSNREAKAKHTGGEVLCEVW